VETIQTILNSYPWNFVQTSKTVELFTNLFTGGHNPNNSFLLIGVRALLAILSASGCELVLQ
jgi:hypothetical protein